MYGFMETLSLLQNDDFLHRLYYATASLSLIINSIQDVISHTVLASFIIGQHVQCVFVLLSFLNVYLTGITNAICNKDNVF